MTNDDNIKDLLRTNAQKAFSLLVKRYQEPAYWHIRRLVVSHADAEDATQETFIRVYRSFGQIAEVKSVRAWVLKIATNEALRIIDRRKAQMVPVDGDGSAAFEAFADDYVDYSRTAEVRLQKAILSLPAKQQLAFNLRYYDDLSYSEIAEAIGTSSVSARMNYHLAKDKIVKYLKTND